jgi:tetratricopeptide (TPR) repeat protein
MCCYNAVFSKITQSAIEFLSLAGILSFSPFNINTINKVLKLSRSELNRVLQELQSYGLIYRRSNICELSHTLIYSYISRHYPADKQKLEALVDYYIDSCKEHVKQGIPGYKLLDPERKHVISTTINCYANKDYNRVTALIWAIDSYLDIQGYLTERALILDIGIKASIELKDRYNEGAFITNLGNTYYSLGQYELALKYHSDALVIHREIGYKQGEASALGNIGLIYSNKGDLDNALKYHSDALVIHREIGYKQGEANQLGNIGLIYKDKGNLDNALKYLQDAKVIFEKIGAKPQLSIVQKAMDEIMEQEKP